MPSTQHMIVRGVPAKLKGKIAARVKAEESNLNDVCVLVLAAKYDVDYTPSGRKSSGEIGQYPHLVLDVPARLKAKIDADARKSRDSIRNVVVRTLADEFGEPFVPTGRWAGRAAA